MRVIGYVRVPTDEQVRAGVSLVAQATKIDAYATVKEWTLREVTRDAGVSAKTLHRPGLARLLALVRGREVDVGVVAQLDRLSRRVRDVYDLVELFEKKGVALVSLHKSLDVTTATGRAMMGLLAVMSPLERELIGERTQAAMQHLKAMGRVHCRPRFSATGADAPTLARMHALRAAGATYQAIAEDLTAAGIPTVRGGRWQAATVLGILRRYLPRLERQAAL